MIVTRITLKFKGNRISFDCYVRTKNISTVRTVIKDYSKADRVFFDYTEE